MRRQVAAAGNEFSNDAAATITGPEKENIMGKQDKSGGSVYRVVEVIGTSSKSWDDAAKNAVRTASGSLRDLRIAEVVKMDVAVKGGKVQAYRTRLLLSFKYEG